MRALFSVSDKRGLVDFARGLSACGWEIIATGGTQKLLEESGVKTTGISEVTGFPEICGGRVKTLHPRVHGGLLGRRDNEGDMQQLKENGIETIEMVCVNLYPFEATVAKPDCTLEDAVEHIDIGGPSMLRSAAKNFNAVTVVCDPDDYSKVLDEIRADGNTSLETRLTLSAKAYTHTAIYDSHIAEYMRRQANLPEKLFLNFDLVQPLRYGENPHQQAKFYKEAEPGTYSVAGARQIQGKELSYNNIQDANAALEIVSEFTEPFCVGLKHMNPCGAAVGKDAAEAWQRAYEADKVSIYGGIVAFNREVTLDIAKALKPIFLEIVMAPSFSAEALELLATKKNLRVLVIDMSAPRCKRPKYTGVTGGLLVQDADTECVEVTTDMCVTDRKPSAQELADINFGWKIVKHVKSNAIVVVKDGATLGVGAGQMNRVGSAGIALEEAKAAGAVSGLVLASDGFLPFDDTVDQAAQYGVSAIVQPGGSIRDNDSIVKANEKGIAMMFTGMRHFKH